MNKINNSHSLCCLLTTLYSYQSLAISFHFWAIISHYQAVMNGQNSARTAFCRNTILLETSSLTMAKMQYPDHCTGGKEHLKSFCSVLLRRHFNVCYHSAFQFLFSEDCSGILRHFTEGLFMTKIVSPGPRNLWMDHFLFIRYWLIAWRFPEGWEKLAHVKAYK